MLVPLGRSSRAEDEVVVVWKSGVQTLSGGRRKSLERDGLSAPTSFSATAEVAANPVT